jgi:LPXTG-motif cell wall-anchored protein
LIAELADVHTDLIVSFRWDDSAWLVLLAGVGAVAAVIAAVLYRRRRRNGR